MKLIYTNLGILTEERVRELRECGYDMQECGCAGSIDDEMHMRGGADYHEMDHSMEEPEAIVIRVVPEEEGMLEEGGMDGTGGSPGYTGNQGALGVGPQGTAGSAASGNPGGANTVRENFNRRAAALLEAWLEEELHGNQKKLDLDDDGEIEDSDLKMLRRGLRDKHVGSDRKHKKQR
jgi:hypothetical protein